MLFFEVLLAAIPFLLLARLSSMIFGTEEKPTVMAFRDTAPALLFGCIFIAPYFGGVPSLPYYFGGASITFVLAWLYYRGQTETRPGMSSVEIIEGVNLAVIWCAILAFLGAVGGGLYYAVHWLRYGKFADATLLSIFGPVKTGWLGFDRIVQSFLELQWPIGSLILCGCITLFGLWLDDQKPKANRTN